MNQFVLTYNAMGSNILKGSLVSTAQSFIRVDPPLNRQQRRDRRFGSTRGQS